MTIHWHWFIIGLLIFSGLTVLFPILAAFARPFIPNIKTRTESLLKTEPSQFDLEILIPAYNESDTLEPTVLSVHKAVLKLKEQYPHLKTRIHIGLDGSTDSTPEIAKQLSETLNIQISNRGFNRGKWKTIEEMIQASQARWIGLVDSGTLWPEHLLLPTFEKMKEPQWIGMGPGYSQNRASHLERLIWWLERQLKTIENWGGGTITLHGATIFFRTAVVQQVIREIMYRPWLNDDVVLSIAVRTWGPTYYFGDKLCIGDIGVRSNRGEFNRRKRMVMGNLEWIRDLFPSLWIQGPDVAILSLRRIFRVFWVWCIILTGVCFQLAFPFLWPITAGLSTLLLMGFIINRRLREAAIVGLLSPLWIFKKTDVKWS